MVASPLKIITDMTGQGLFLRVSGDVFLETAPELREAIVHELTCLGNRRVIVDIRDIDIMDSSGIGALLNSRKAMAGLPVEMYVLAALGSQPHRILAVAGLVQPLNVIFDTNKLSDLE
jgi:anti-anti-sigma factor